MAEFGPYFMNERSRDGILLLGADRACLEQRGSFLRAERDSDREKRSAGKLTRTLVRWWHRTMDRSSWGAPVWCKAFSGPGVMCYTAAGVCLQMPMHRIVLSTGSEYFRTLMSTLVGPDTEHYGYPIIVMLEEDVTAAQWVVQFLYTKVLIGDFSTAALMRILLVADKWVVPECVSVCCSSITKLYPGPLSFEDVKTIYGSYKGPLPPTLPDTLTQLLNKAYSKMLQLFGDIAVVVASTTITDQVLQLSYTAVLALLGSDELKTDSEDTVLMLLSWWLEAPERAHDKLDAHHLIQLTETIHYSRLSSTYLTQALLLAPRLCPDSSQLLKLYEFKSLTLEAAALYASSASFGCPVSWFKTKRPPSTKNVSDTVTLTLVITSPAMCKYTAAVRAMKNGGTAPAKFSTTAEYKGLRLSLSFVSTGQQGVTACDVDNFSVYVHVCARLPSSSSCTSLKCGVACSWKVTINQDSKPGRASFSWPIAARLHNQERGFRNFFQRVSSLPGDPELLSWWDPFFVGGNVRLTAEFKDERHH